MRALVVYGRVLSKCHLVSICEYMREYCMRAQLTLLNVALLSRYKPVVPSDSRVIISAHYDSRGSFGSKRAPGGNDDGSGTTSVLAIARAIGRKGIKFHANVELIAFGGEEQGRLGSIFYARA